MAGPRSVMMKCLEEVATNQWLKVLRESTGKSLAFYPAYESRHAGGIGIDDCQLNDMFEVILVRASSTSDECEFAGTSSVLPAIKHR